LKYSVILLLLLCEFTYGQIPGFPKFLGTRNFPTVYTLSFTPSGDLSAADVTAQVINTSLYPIIESGILWGSGSVDINTYSGRISDGDINGQPFTRNITPLPEIGSISIVAYATTSAGTFYGKTLTIPQQKVRSPFTGKIWMTYNLGATALANVSQPRGDTASYGYLYQWGRRSDGHQIILPLVNPTYDVNGVATSGTAFSSPSITTRASSYTNTNSSYISYNGDWLLSQNDNLWQGINGLNNPCPAGFRVPTLIEFTNESDNLSSQTSTGLLNSFLMLPMAGLRKYTGSLDIGPNSYFNYDVGAYWTSTVSGTFAKKFGFSSTTITSNGPGRAYGYSVRCIMGEPTSGGTSVISSFGTSSSTGQMVSGQEVSGVTQTINLSATIGSYDIVTNTTNGITFAGKGTFTSTGSNQIVLTASGTPSEVTPSGTYNSFTLNTTPSYTFTRYVTGSTNGSAVVDSYTPISSSGTMFQSLSFDNTAGVTQTISANVTTPGTYNIKAINNGVTFIASGTFTNSGAQNIVLTGTGTPTAAGDYTFTSNTIPSAIFSNTTLTPEPTSGGTAQITWASVSQSGLTTAQTTENNRNIVRLTEASTYNPPFIQYIAVNVTRIGSYNIRTISNRNLAEGHTLRLVGSGTFSTTGVQTIPLYYYGQALNNNGGNPLNHYFNLPKSTDVFYIIRNSQ